MTAYIHTASDSPLDSVYTLATFGAGCFWHTEEAFRTRTGVMHTSVGYMGGHFANPCYLDVLSRITGHAEVAQIQYDPTLISYESLLDVFWACHDPTTPNRQGPDRGEQYRSVIFCHTSDQLSAAKRSKANRDASNAYTKPIVTQIQPSSDYWLATEDHQQYLYKKAIKRESSKTLGKAD
ncbi:MAG: peptide-methionine (S)-S-oxide reductase MsrA [Cyanobacteria bacterium J06621_11]